MASPIRLRTVLVEDVALTRAALRRLLAAHGDVEVVGEAEGVDEAVALAGRAAADLLFLDVHLADGLGTAVLPALAAAGRAPAVVFLTANPEHAVEAFAQEAVDYLLKPVRAEEIARALDRVRRRLGAAPAVAAAPIEVRDGSRTRYLAPELVDRVESAGHYQCLHVAGQVHLLRQPLGDLLDRLGPGFVRVHRGAAVRADRIRAIGERRNGDGVLTLADGAELRFSRSFRDGIERAISRR